MQTNIEIRHNYFSAVKLFIFPFFGIVSAFLFGLFLKYFLENFLINILIWIGIAGLIFLISYFFQVFFVSDKKQTMFVFLFQALALVILFFSSGFLIIILGIIVFTAFNWGYSFGRKYIDNTLKINFWEVSRVSLPKAILAMALVIGVVSFLTFQNNSNADSNIKLISSSAINNALSSNSNFGIIRKVIPNFDVSAKFTDFAQKLAEDEINKSPEIAGLPKSAKKMIISQSVADFQKRAEEFLGIPINSNEKISNLISDSLDFKFSKLTEQSKNILYFIIGALIFLLIESVSWPIRVIVSLVAFIFYKILISSGFARIEFENKMKEVIVL